MDFVKFPSINQFRHLIRNVRQRSENGIHPTLPFRGTVKLHGTNASIVFHRGEIGFQSRTRIITPVDDNAGFAAYMHPLSKDERFGHGLRTLVSQISEKGYHFETAFERVIIYGEWCGGNIQSGVAINQVDKMFVIFAIKIGDRWMDMQEMAHVELPDYRIFNIMRFPTWEVEIDFNQPELVQQTLIELTNEVERKCPVGAYFGVDGIGEGIVWTCTHPDYRSSKYVMKVKGEKHSVSKVKTLAPVDVEKMNTVQEFLDKTVTENRLQQGIDFLRESGLPLTEKSTGDFIRWVYNDIVKEEFDTMCDNGIARKDIGSPLAYKARSWYFQYLEELETEVA